MPTPAITLNTPISDQVTRQYGGYAAGQFTLTDRLKAILGSRLSWYHYSYSGTERDENNVVTPYMGLTYELNNWASAYASYTDIFNPQSARDISGNTLEPEVGASYELGFKGVLRRPAQRLTDRLQNPQGQRGTVGRQHPV